MTARDEGILPVRRIAVIGAGRVGTAVARALVDAGYEVSLSGSADPTLVALVAAAVAPGTTAMWTAEAVSRADLVILAMPLHRLPMLDPALLDGRIVIDAMNYWQPVDGTLPEFEDQSRTTSEIVQQMLPGATIVKTFNHVGYHDLEPDRRSPGDPERRGMAVAADDAAAARAVAAVIDAIGYDPVTLPTLASGRTLQPGNPVFGARLTAEQIQDLTGVGGAARSA